MPQRFGSGRLEAFSDGVFAIAITLLVLEISVPEADFDHLGRALVDLWPSYLAYATSFLTIGATWVVHHAIFRRMGHADHNVTRLNLLLLMTVSFLPFPTGLLAQTVGSDEGERVAVIFYGGVLVVVLLLLAAMCRYVASQPLLLREGVQAGDLEAMASRLTPGLVFYVLVFILAIVAPGVAAFGFLVVAALALSVLKTEEEQE